MASTTLNLSGNNTGVATMNIDAGGTLNLSGSNADVTSVNLNGSLTVSGGNALNDSAAVALATGALLRVAGNESIGQLSGAAGSSMILDATLTTNIAAASAFSGSISGAGGITKTGAGTFTLDGVNNYSGATTILQGTLQLGGGQAIGDSSAVYLADDASAILDLSNVNETVGSLAGGGLTGGNVLLGSATLAMGGNNTSTEYNGLLSGTGGITKFGAGTQTFGGDNNYTGDTVLNAGGLKIRGNQATSDFYLNGGILGGSPWRTRTPAQPT